MRIKNYLLVFFLSFLIASRCSKDKQSEQLPPETQTGAGTFGCKIDGMIYKANYPDAIATYIYMNFSYPSSSGYFLNIGANDMIKWNVTVFTDSLSVDEGNIYLLNNYAHIPGTAFGRFSSYGNEYYTKPDLQGELRISKFDAVNKIISGTFWFDAKDTISNKIAHIREGRFDLHFTE